MQEGKKKAKRSFWSVSFENKPVVVEANIESAAGLVLIMSLSQIRDWGYTALAIKTKC